MFTHKVIDVFPALQEMCVVAIDKPFFEKEEQQAYSRVVVPKVLFTLYPKFF